MKFVDADCHIGLVPENAQVNGIKTKLRQNTRENRRNPHTCMKHPCGQSRQHAGQKCRCQRNPCIPAAGNHDGCHGTACCNTAIYCQVRNIQDPIRYINTDRHDSPDQSLGHGTRQCVDQLDQFHIHSSNHRRQGREIFTSFLVNFFHFEVTQALCIRPGSSRQVQPHSPHYTF